MKRNLNDCSAGSWLKFFTSAGIKTEFAETYAVTFQKNQISLGMLPEIKKEYLLDMGISLMGHIIAILRHAKFVHEETETKATLLTDKSTVEKVVQKTPIKKIAITAPGTRISEPARPQIKTPIPVKPVARKRPLDTTPSPVPAKKTPPIEKRTPISSYPDSSPISSEGVFSRLGGISKPVIATPPKSTIFKTSEPIRATPKPRASTPPIMFTCTMRADEADSTTNPTSSKSKSGLYKRLGRTSELKKQPAKRVHFNPIAKIHNNPTVPKRSRVNQPIISKPQPKGVFSRLG